VRSATIAWDRMSHRWRTRVGDEPIGPSADTAPLDGTERTEQASSCRRARSKAPASPRQQVYASADPFSQGNDDPLWPAHVRHAPDVLVPTDAADQAVAVRGQPVDRPL
jgi:hypothetical protein